MEIVILVTVLIAVGVLASRYRQDSRERLASAEERLATAGFQWTDASRHHGKFRVDSG